MLFFFKKKNETEGILARLYCTLSLYRYGNQGPERAPYLLAVELRLESDL